jgi:hypothetical protein
MAAVAEPRYVQVKSGSAGGPAPEDHCTERPLQVVPEHVRVEFGDSVYGQAPVAGGSAGTASWGTAVFRACRQLVESGEDEAHVETSDEIEAEESYSRHAFGAQFVEVWVNTDTGEIRVPRLLGVFAAGTIVNPKTACSQFISGMTIDEDDSHLNPIGSKGIGPCASSATRDYSSSGAAEASPLRGHPSEEPSSHARRNSSTSPDSMATDATTSSRSSRRSASPRAVRSRLS